MSETDTPESAIIPPLSDFGGPPIGSLPPAPPAPPKITPVPMGHGDMYERLVALETNLRAVISAILAKT